MFSSIKKALDRLVTKSARYIDIFNQENNHGYTLSKIRTLGFGSFGKVYLVQDLFGDKFALK